MTSPEPTKKLLDELMLLGSHRKSDEHSVAFTIIWYRASTKLQINSNNQNSKFQTKPLLIIGDLGDLVFDSGFGIWDLKF